MSIRKQGSVSGEVTGVEQPGLAKTAAAADDDWWDEDETALAAETERE